MEELYGLKKKKILFLAGHLHFECKTTNMSHHHLGSGDIASHRDIWN